MMISGNRSVITHKHRKLLKSDTKGGINEVMALSECLLKKDWDNEYDERWNKY